MLWYIFIVALLNMGLGFGVAVYLGRRSSAPSDLDESPAPFPLRSEESGPEPIAEAATESKQPDEQPAAEAAAPPERDQTLAETSVKELQDVLARYEGQVSTVDDLLRVCTEAPDVDKIESCLSTLKDARDDYIESCEQVQSTFAEIEEEEEFANVCDELRVALQVQLDQVESVNATAEAFDLKGDLKEECRVVVGETSKVLDASHQLRDTLDKTLIEVAREEEWLKTAEQSLRDDQLTQLLSRTGAEAGLQEWWEKDPQRSRKLSLGMIDLDRFAQLNERHGHKVGDLILAAISRLLSNEKQGAYTPTRFSGQRFLLIFPDLDVRHVTNTLERLRQEIEIASFQWNDSEIKVTISSAATEADPEDTSQTLFARMEATLQEAKRYGRNRTFLHEGKYPAPVVPPNFTLEPRVVEL